MTNFAILFVIAAFICATNVHVYADDGDNDNNGGKSSPFGSDLDKQLNFPPLPNPTFTHMDLPNPSDIINLKPKDKNTKVSGSYSSFSSSVEMKDGHIVNQSASSKNIDNKNGNVTEVDANN